MKKYTQLIVFCIFIILSVSSFNCGSGSKSPMKIKSAKRAQRLLLGSPTDHQELSAVHPKTHAVLDLRISGITVEEFKSVSSDSMYIVANEAVCRPMVIISGIKGGKEIMQLCVIVPRDAVEMTFHLGSKYEKTFTVEKKIYDELKDW